MYLYVPSAKALESKAEAKTDAKKTVPAKKTAKDDTDSDSDDDVSDLKPEPVPRAAPKPRRVSVSSESVDPAKLKAQRANITSIPKSPEVLIPEVVVCVRVVHFRSYSYY